MECKMQKSYKSDCRTKRKFAMNEISVIIKDISNYIGYGSKSFELLGIEHSETKEKFYKDQLKSLLEFEKDLSQGNVKYRGMIFEQEQYIDIAAITPTKFVSIKKIPYKGNAEKAKKYAQELLEKLNNYETLDSKG